MEPKRLIAALDLGTTRTKVVVAEVGPDGVDVVGVGQSPSQGIQKGRVVNVEVSVAAVEAAISEAEMMCGREIREVHLGMAGGFVQCVNRSGMVPIRREVRRKDLDQVRQVAIAMPLAPDQQLLEVVPQGFTVDETDGVEDPTGMAATRLDARYHVVVAVASAARNLMRCCEMCGLNVASLSLQQLASAEAVLDEDERELGVCLVDIGGGTSDLAIYRNGKLTHTAVVPIGGSHLTGDLAHGLRAPRGEAERIKVKHGCAHASLVGSEETFEVSGLGGRLPRPLPRMALVEILGPRVEEMMALVQREIRRDGGEDDLAAGVVFTGGTSDLPGLLDVAEEVLCLQARRGVPSGVGGLDRVVANPCFATAVGLVLRVARGKTAGAVAAGLEKRGGLAAAVRRSYVWARDFLL